MNAKEYVNKYKDELINDMMEIIEIKSVREEAKEGMPFGEGPTKALQKGLEIAERYGFKTVNLDNYVGYVEMGEGEDIIGILAHVDVVPEGEGWTSDPYKPEIRDGRLYGRGVADDKGPGIISLHAMRIVRDMGVKLNKRVRLVLGANEETGSACVRYYKAKEGGFQYGFSPDAEFPLIFGEKGGFGGNFSAPLSVDGAKTVIESIAGGVVSNMVCPDVTVYISGEGLEEIKAAFDGYKPHEEITTESSFTDCGKLKLYLKGKAAHASFPEQGVNAISYMIDFLKDHITDSPFVKAYSDLVGLCYYGEKCGAQCEDQYGVLTMNLGVISTENGVATVTVDCRVPITIDFKDQADQVVKNFENAGCTFNVNRLGSSLFIDPESDFIQALYGSYVKVTGDTENKPFTIGGGTYAKTFENVVAFGIEFPGENNQIHMPDENMHLESIYRCCEVFVEAIQRLLAL